MCWITFTPKPVRHHHHSDDGSSLAELVRVHKKGPGPRYSKIRITAPIESEKHHHWGYRHHHHHPQFHPLHMHPTHFPDHHHHHWKLRGRGERRSPAPPTSAPPPSRSPSSCASPREPIYRTQIVEPAKTEVRETTRVALKQMRPDRGRLRRVAGFEVLGRDVPWDWDCVSSVAAGDGRHGGNKLPYPPFGNMDRWM